MIKKVITILIFFFIIFFIKKIFYEEKIIDNSFNIYYEKNFIIDKEYGLNGKNLDKIDYSQKVGKGVFISENIFLTAKHIFDKNSENYFIKIKNKKYFFKIEKIFKNKDLVKGKILDYKTNNFVKNFGITKKIGEKIFYFKNGKKIFGKILQKNIELKKLGLKNLVKTDILLYPGNSGTPVFNTKNELIGIFILIEKDKKISYYQKIIK